MFDFQNAAPNLTRWLLDVGLQTTLLLCGVGLCSLVLHRASAALRHLVWALTFAGLLLLPFLNGVMPQRKVLVASAAMPMDAWFLRVPVASSSRSRETEKSAPLSRAESPSPVVAEASPKSWTKSRTSIPSMPASWLMAVSRRISAISSRLPFFAMACATSVCVGDKGGFAAVVTPQSNFRPASPTHRHNASHYP